MTDSVSVLVLFLRHQFRFFCVFFFFQAEDGIRDGRVTGVQTCALPISSTKPTISGPSPTSHLVNVALPEPMVDSQPMPDRKSVVVGKECRSRWSPYH